MGQTIFSAGIHYGRMLKINPLWPEVTHNSRAIELNISQKVSGDRTWHGLFRYPELGITALYIQPGNPDIFGEIFTITPMISFKLAEGNHYKFNIGTGYSLGIATKPFDRITNPDNNVVGARLNSINLLKLETTFYPKGNFVYTVGMSAFHLSNARTRVPNLGINIPALNLRVGYKKPSPQTVRRSRVELPKRIK